MNTGIHSTLGGLILGSSGLPLSFGSGNVTATGFGLDSSDAALLENTVNIVTAANGDTGVILPVPHAGQVVEVCPVTAGYKLKVWPHSGGKINGGSTNAAVDVDPATRAVFVCTDGTNWGARYISTPG